MGRSLIIAFSPDCAAAPVNLLRPCGFCRDQGLLSADSLLRHTASGQMQPARAGILLRSCCAIPGLLQKAALSAETSQSNLSSGCDALTALRTPVSAQRAVWLLSLFPGVAAPSPSRGSCRKQCARSSAGNHPAFVRHAPTSHALLRACLLRRIELRPSNTHRSSWRVNAWLHSMSVADAAQTRKRSGPSGGWKIVRPACTSGGMREDTVREPAPRRLPRVEICASLGVLVRHLAVRSGSEASPFRARDHRATAPVVDIA